MDVRFGLQRKLSAEELMLLNCGAGSLQVQLTSQEVQSPMPCLTTAGRGHIPSETRCLSLQYNQAKQTQPLY